MGEERGKEVEEGQYHFKLLGVDFRVVSKAASAVMHHEQCLAAVSSLAWFMGPNEFWEALLSLLDPILQSGKNNITS